MPLLVKLYFFSSGVHQVMFLALSTLPFAIGQIQDVGLIFLAGMVRNLMKWAEEDGWTEEELIATALWQCAVSTCMVGLCIVLVGRLQLGTYVQMLPLPVVAGYLAYIGYFCLAAGLASTTDLELTDPLSLIRLLDPKLAWKLGLLVLMTSVLLVVRFKVDTIRGIPTMPLVLAMIPAIFFAALWWFNISPEDCRATGWLPPPVPASHGPAIIHYFDPSKVKWDSMAAQWSGFVGLAIVVFFGSALDVAAIQAEMGSQQLDFDAELNTIGWGDSGQCPIRSNHVPLRY
jgi:SulP family sulfate permease